MSLSAKGRFEAPLAEITARLPQLERAMLICRGNGVTHERIGRIETVAEEAGWVSFSGSAHSARVDSAVLQGVRFDRSSGMKDKILPRLDFLGADGEPVFSVVSLSGLEEFDAAFGDLAFAELPETTPDPLAAALGEIGKPVLAEDDPAYAAFTTAREAGVTVAVRFSAPGFQQEWQGEIREIKPAMGFLNVMTPDFHLHLKGGVVGSWQEDPQQWRALDAAGQPLGLDLVRVPA